MDKLTEAEKAANEGYREKDLAAIRSMVSTRAS